MRANPLNLEGVDYELSIYIEETLEILVNAIKKEGPFDGVLGFSQGMPIFRLLCFAA